MLATQNFRTVDAMQQDMQPVISSTAASAYPALKADVPQSATSHHPICSPSGHSGHGE
jgi:hypothetical protein